jgi:hypothetical protein
MERFVGPWDRNFDVRPELTDEEKNDILNSGKKLKLTKHYKVCNQIKREKNSFNKVMS